MVLAECNTVGAHYACRAHSVVLVSVIYIFEIIIVTDVSTDGLESLFCDMLILDLGLTEAVTIESATSNFLLWGHDENQYSYLDLTRRLGLVH